MKTYLFSLCIIVLITTKAVAQQSLFNHSFNAYKSFGLSEAEINTLKQEGDLSIFNESRHSTKLAKQLFNKKVGKTIKKKSRVGKIEYEVVAEANVLHYRMNYIFFDGETYDYETIENSRERMLGLLEDDYKFESLARQYSMDFNRRRGGDSGWFKIESVAPAFRTAITNTRRYAGEVFKVNLPELNWYYLVKKTYSPQSFREILVIKRTD
jgi:hypothetical protein